MKDKDIYDDINSIKNIMERSTRFISLSGLSGVMAGIYALIGAGIAYSIIPDYSVNAGADYSANHNLDMELFGVAMAVLILSIGTAVWLTARKARRRNQSTWNESSRTLVGTGLQPLLTGGCFAFILFINHNYLIIAPACLVFYGLALAAASKYTYGDVKWLGLMNIILGLAALIQPAYGLYFWALGFGVLHILYGSIMHFKYDSVSA